MAEDGLGEGEASESYSPGKIPLLSCGPKQSSVTPPETGSPWDVEEEAQGNMSSPSEGFPAPRPAWEGDRVCPSVGCCSHVHNNTRKGSLCHQAPQEAGTGLQLPTT